MGKPHGISIVGKGVHRGLPLLSHLLFSPFPQGNSGHGWLTSKDDMGRVQLLKEVGSSHGQLSCFPMISGDHLEDSFPKEGALAMIWKNFEGKIHLMEATHIGSLFGLLYGS